MHASLEVLRFDTLQCIQNVIAIETGDILVTVISNIFSRNNIIVFWYNISDPVFALTMMAMIYELNILILLTHWGRDKMAAISQTTLSNALSWKKMLEFRLKFHWSLFLRVQ